MSIGTREFGSLADGSRATLFTLKNGSGAEAAFCDYGAMIVSLLAPDARGRLADVILGYDSASDYKHHMGATVGRFAGPIAGGRCRIDGKPVQLGLNGGTYHIHGGAKGFAKRIWTADPGEGPEGPFIRFSRTSADGEEGYPGALNVRVTHTWTHGFEWRIEYEAVCDRPTLCNLTNHAYFNLTGHSSGPVLDQTLQLEAEVVNLNDADIIATGPVIPILGTPFDFTRPRRIGDAIDAADGQLRMAGGYDHNFLLPRQPGRPFRKAARAEDPVSGRTMEMWTTEPGFQFYAGNSIPDGEPGKAGAVYGRRHGFCLEAQRAPGWPDEPGVAGAVLRPGDTYRQFTAYRFQP